MFTPTLERCWSWEGVIEINSIALKGIIDALFAMLGVATRLSPAVYSQVLRLLQPTESAVRRLIIMAARGLVVKQAKRLARWRLKREAMPSPPFRSPLRPGYPPGYRRTKPREIDEILAECHSLAWEALKKSDTS